jgi:steroid delta-isomerase-like uncharacterized protein
MSATTQQHSATEQRVRQIWSEVFTARDLTKAREWWSEDTVDHFLALGVSARGPDELTGFFRELLDAVPDIRMDIENVVADDATRHAVLQWHCTGTTSGKPFQGIEPPPGKSIDLRGCDVFRLDEDGRVAENTIYYDASDFARQIGMLPPRDSALDRATISAFNAATRLRARLKR